MQAARESRALQAMQAARESRALQAMQAARESRALQAMQAARESIQGICEIKSCKKVYGFFVLRTRAGFNVKMKLSQRRPG